jgi:GntR family transcriptional regulator
MLNPESPLPLYHQLSEILMEQIRNGKYTPGDVMPSETGMAKQYGIGRPTVRQAMDVLVQKGLVKRKRGSGTFVNHQDKQVDLFSLAGTSQAFLTQGINTASRTIEAAKLKNIKDDTANPFNGESAFFLSRLILIQEDPNQEDLAKGDPVLLEEFYLHPVLFSGLDALDLENRSLSGVVSDHYYLKPDTGRQSFKISMLSKTRARWLKLEPQSPILEVERTLNFPGAKGAIFSRLFCRTDNFAFSQTMNLKNNIYTQATDTQEVKI